MEINNQSEEFETRPYQQKIIEVCIDRNSIVYLPTGAGKSFIAIQVIKHFSSQLERKYSEGGKRSVFLVNTVCLAKQQAQSISSMVPYTVAVLSGEQNVDFWKEPDWLKVLEESEILVATAQVILDAVRHSFLKLEQINVIIFDECHHGRKDHAYHEIMKLFRNFPMNNVRIIGLSGMLVGNDSKIRNYNVADELIKLESTFQSTIITVDSLDDHKNVLLCSTSAREGLVRFNQSAEHLCVAEIRGKLENMQELLRPIQFENYKTIDPKSLRETIPKKIKELILLFKDFEYQVQEMGAYGGYLSLLSMLIQFELIKRFSDTEKYRQIVKACITTTERCINRMEQALGLCRSNTSTILTHSSEKVQVLIKLLSKVFADPNREKDLQCIVFVKRRSSAKAIYHALKAYASFDPNFPIIPDFMVGINNELPESIESILSSNYNSLTLERFKKKETNCIIASSVLEEGIDLQMCNLVVMYDRPDTYRSYVQARGRARVTNSQYVVLAPTDKVDDFQKKVKNWRDVDCELKTQLYLKTLDREPPTEENIQKEQEDAWEAFVTPISKSVLSNLNSVSLLNHYSSKMPSDRFTNVNVLWRRIDNEDGSVSAAIQLPSQSVLKEEIISDPQVNVRLAKQHAAFKACKMLYENGDLNDNLVPVDEKQKVELVEAEYFGHWKTFSGDKKTAGNRAHRRYHQIKTPKVLQESSPMTEEMSFLYRIMIRPKFEAPNQVIGVLKKMLGNGKDFGILTSKRIPKLCKMRLFMSYGEVEVEISALPITVTLQNDNELNQLQNFHVAIFRDVLNAWMKFFVLDKTSYLIVPLTEDVQIDWKLVGDFQSVEQPRELSYDEINKMDFSRKDYYHRVINPVYREKEPRYVVVNVCEDLSPLSPFPNGDYPSYKEYYETKFYGMNITRLDQPLVEAKGISQNLNLFFPGAGNKGKQQKQKQERENRTEFLIPSLCHNFKFPADFWMKALLLPSVCHRMHYLLIAEELRVWLIDEKIDRGNGKQIYELDVDYGNYDEREQEWDKFERDHESSGKLWNVAELLKQYADRQPSTSSGEGRHTNALLLWDKSKLPIDIDRNWLSITEAEIDYYFTFLNQNKNTVSPASMSRLQELNGSPKRHDRLLTDSEDRSTIKLIHIDGMFSSVQQKDLIKVLTTSNAGDVFDMERFEVLGDGFLKFITSLFLFKEYKDWHEGYLTTLKGKLVSNRNLFYIGKLFGLSDMIKSSMYKATEMLPPSIRLPETMQKMIEEDKTLLMKLWGVESLNQQEIISGEVRPAVLQPFATNDQEDAAMVETSLLPYIQQHHIGDKIVADAVEAFLGVVVQSLGINAGLKFCQKMNILPEAKNLEHLLTEPIPPRLVVESATVNDVRLPNRSKLEKIIGYKFKNGIYLTQAMTHSSYPVKVLGSYQQLEFLGDAVLDFLISSYIIERCPDMDPGKLTDLRSALVNNVTLACVVVRNGIHKFLLSENVMLSEAIRKFENYQKSKGYKVVLDQIILLETEEDASTAESIDVPKVIGDVFESIIGAVFLDSGLNLLETWEVIYGMLKGELQEFMINVPYQIVRQLFEFEKGSSEPKFFEAEVIDEENVGVPVQIKCRGERKVFLGVGKNKKLAKKCAAKLALKALMQR